MATRSKNLSNYDKENVPSSAKMKFGIVVSDWNDKVTYAML